MAAVNAAGVPNVVWVNLRQAGANAGGYANINAAIQSAAAAYPKIRVADWNSYSAGQPWFGSDGLHLDVDGGPGPGHVREGPARRRAAQPLQPGHRHRHTGAAPRLAPCLTARDRRPHHTGEAGAPGGHPGWRCARGQPGAHRAGRRQGRRPGRRHGRDRQRHRRHRLRARLPHGVPIRARCRAHRVELELPRRPGGRRAGGGEARRRRGHRRAGQRPDRCPRRPDGLPPPDPGLAVQRRRSGAHLRLAAGVPRRRAGAGRPGARGGGRHHPRPAGRHRRHRQPDRHRADRRRLPHRLPRAPATRPTGRTRPPSTTSQGSRSPTSPRSPWAPTAACASTAAHRRSSSWTWPAGSGRPAPGSRGSRRSGSSTPAAARPSNRSWDGPEPVRSSCRWARAQACRPTPAGPS